MALPTVAHTLEQFPGDFRQVESLGLFKRLIKTSSFRHSIRGKQLFVGKYFLLFQCIFKFFT